MTWRATSSAPARRRGRRCLQNRRGWQLYIKLWRECGSSVASLLFLPPLSAPEAACRTRAPADVKFVKHKDLAFGAPSLRLFSILNKTHPLCVSVPGSSPWRTGRGKRPAGQGSHCRLFCGGGHPGLARGWRGRKSDAGLIGARPVAGASQNGLFAISHLRETVLAGFGLLLQNFSADRMASTVMHAVLQGSKALHAKGTT